MPPATSNQSALVGSLVLKHLAMEATFFANRGTIVDKIFLYLNNVVKGSEHPAWAISLKL